jgi:RNA ligase (TIGR02306 family)
MDRKLASIRRVAKIEPIEGADKIEKLTIDGWHVVSRKGNFQEGDLCIYHEIDAFLPTENHVYSFLAPKDGRKVVFNGVEGHRLKTIKLRGQVSQGLALPLDALMGEHGFGWDDYPLPVEGADFTQALGIQLYEKPLPAQLAGTVRSTYPFWIHKTDQERIQNLTNTIPNILDEEFEVTMKLDGSSMTVYHNDGIISVCSRNMDLIETDGNAFWQCARQQGLIDLMMELEGYALQGELMGPGVQGNQENLDKLVFFMFDVWNIKEQRYLRPIERWELCARYSITHCPVVGPPSTLVEEYLSTLAYPLGCYGKTIDEILKSAEGPSLKAKQREGIVFKSMAREFSFKAISNSFLLGEKD